MKDKVEKEWEYKRDSIMKRFITSMYVQPYESLKIEELEDDVNRKFQKNINSELVLIPNHYAYRLLKERSEDVEDLNKFVIEYIEKEESAYPFVFVMTLKRVDNEKLEQIKEYIADEITNLAIYGKLSKY